MKLRRHNNKVYTTYTMEIFPNVDISHIVNEVDRTFISVGAGNGVIEYKIQERVKFPVIAVDPNPESYQLFPADGKYIAPMYADVEELLCDSIISSSINSGSNCILFLCWPEFEGNTDGYDFRAIRLLRPKKIITLYEERGGSGSDMFHMLMKRCGLPNKFYNGFGPHLKSEYTAKKVIVSRNKHPFGINTDVFSVLERQ